VPPEKEWEAVIARRTWHTQAAREREREREGGREGEREREREREREEREERDRERPGWSLEAARLNP
jgi:hypothetical protein